MKTDTGVFDASHLRPLASLNRRKVIALPGIEAQAIGKTGSELLSKGALIELIRPYQRELGLDGVTPGEFPERFNSLLESQDPIRRRIAEAIAQGYGRRLGWLVASILLSPVGLTSPLDEWEAAYLNHWKTNVDQFFLGGGLSNGRFGKVICPQVESVLVQCGIPGKKIELTEYPSYLALIGAARRLPAGTKRTAVVADFGMTRAKRGIAVYNQENALNRLQIMPTRDITALTHGGPAGLAEGMIDLIVEALMTAGPVSGLALKILCSVATYVEDGEPLKINRGAYTSFNQLSPQVALWFSERIGQAAGMQVELEFVHDCDAAACALAGEPRSALLMLGSSLCVGFAPPAAGHRPLAGDFTLIREREF